MINKYFVCVLFKIYMHVINIYVYYFKSIAIRVSNENPIDFNVRRIKT